MLAINHEFFFQQARGTLFNGALKVKQAEGLTALRHGNKQTMSRELVQSADCACWLSSTNGTKFRHPDAEDPWNGAGLAFTQAVASVRPLHVDRKNEPRNRDSRYDVAESVRREMKTRQ